MNPQQGQPFNINGHRGVAWGAGYTPQAPAAGQQGTQPQPGPYQGYQPQQQVYSQPPAYPYSNQHPYPQPMQQYPPVQNNPYPQQLVQQPYQPAQNNPYQQPYGNPYAQPVRASQPAQQLFHSQYYVQPSPYGEAPSVPSIDVGGFSLPIPVLLVATALLILAISMLLQAAWLMWISVLIAGGIAFFLWKTPYQAEVKGHLIIAAALAVLSLVIAIVALVSGNRPDTASQPMQGYNYSQPAQETQGRSNFPTLTSAPTVVPTSVPTQKPTAAPTWTPVPTRAPTPTPRPTATPAEVTHDGIALGMQLYYNTDGGSYYHTTPNCTAINAKYLPLKGKITYSQLTESKFKRLKPCNSCSAPVRPHSH